MHHDDAAPPPDRTTYLVTYTPAGSPGTREAEVTVVPGYSQESDIPRLLAARLTGDPDDAVRITIRSLRPL
ncbi:hypothetical protein GCM10010193_00720 [Kitasatospora atroaurantiaca]|uniref:Uncharacterized protein n=1 Tax=Kitasatospora atroaurantiaca TaxID=285545 RepID=A0A561EL63_9ACTN|nr:hypothetical protein [Kitasatospora atroaurantiaca]TWE16299.1 hypothetical protein FB465_1277 [Kitasatospora atroaurantiaca]